MIICAYCGKTIEGTKYRTHKRKKYHSLCFQELQGCAEADNSVKQGDMQSEERRHLEGYVCSAFGLESVPYLICKQIEDYTSQNGFTLTGIEKSLHYFYTVKGNPVDRRKPSIGIVPYVYEEARLFYERAFETNWKNKAIQLEDKNVTVKIRPQDRSIACRTKIEDL